MSKKKAVLLINLGSPDSTKVSDVRRYLREFLMDGKVLDAPAPIRFFVVHACILPFRPKESAEAYEQVWLPEGSPLIVTSKNVQTKLQDRVDVPIELAMRYQNPSVEHAVGQLKNQGAEEVLVIPLFPHYAMSSYESAVERVKEVAAKRAPQMKLQIVPPYYEEPRYLDALVASTQEYVQQPFDHLLFSFHGIPERHLRKSDTTGCHCLKVENCCEVASPAHETCYKAQCLRTMHALAERLSLPKEKYSVAFQSRLGKDPWLTPYTDFEVKRLAEEGVKRLLVICPAFVSDCLETIEEIGMRAKEDFEEAGGEELILIPCLNEHPKWIEALESMVADFTGSANSAVA